VKADVVITSVRLRSSCVPPDGSQNSIHQLVIQKHADSNQRVDDRARMIDVLVLFRAETTPTDPMTAAPCATAHRRAARSSRTDHRGT